MRLASVLRGTVLSLAGVAMLAGTAVADPPSFLSTTHYWFQNPGGDPTPGTDDGVLANPEMTISPTAIGHRNGDNAAHAFTVALDGSLWDAFSPDAVAVPAQWSRTDITAITGQTVSIAVGLTAMYLGGDNPSTQVFGISPSGHLLSFVVGGDQGNWQFFDLSAATGSGANLTTTPHVIVVGSTVHVYVTDSGKHLHDFYKPSTTNWQNVDITAQTGEHAIFGVPYAYGGNSIQTVSTSAGGHLIIFIQAINPDGTLVGTPPSWFDITQLSGNTEQPFGMSSPVVAGGGTVNIFVSDVNHNLIDFTKTPTSQWQVRTIDTSVVTDETPAAYWSTATGWHVLIINNGGQVVDYTGDGFTPRVLPTDLRGFGDPSLVAVGSGLSTVLTFANLGTF